MMGILLVLGALIAVMVGSELALKGTKLQTGLSRVIVVWGLMFLLATYPVWRFGGTGPIPFVVFWGGAFLSWFGVRSHIESSILLRMVYLLRKKPMSDTELLESYASHYGPGMRMEELYRGGMAAKTDSGIVVTAKGKNILGVVARLRPKASA